MAASSKVGDLTPAVDLILQPLLIEALTAIDEGKALEDAFPAGTDSVALGAAVQRLIAIGAVLPSPTAPFGHHTMTPRGHQLTRLLEDLENLIPPGEVSSGEF